MKLHEILSASVVAMLNLFNHSLDWHYGDENEHKGMVYLHLVWSLALRKDWKQPTWMFNTCEAHITTLGSSLFDPCMNRNVKMTVCGFMGRSVLETFLRSAKNVCSLSAGFGFGVSTEQ